MSNHFMMLAMVIAIAGQASSVIKSNTTTSPLDGYQSVGHGIMTVLFWKVYRAELYVSNTLVNKSISPQALKITYLRDIDRKDLIEATQDQWIHIGLDTSKQHEWLEKLNTIFPHIKKDESITLVIDRFGISNFYWSNSTIKNKHIGQINDADFGQSFLAIWLSDKTSRPKLRRKLLGGENE